jgi:hypothetical protein
VIDFYSLSLQKNTIEDEKDGNHSDGAAGDDYAGYRPD